MNQLKSEAEVHDTGYCWRQGWTYPGESLWSLLSKFMLLNQVGITALQEIFGCRTGDKRWFPASIRTMLTNQIFEHVSASKLEDVLGLSAEQISISTIDAYTFTQYARLSIRYCPSCIQAGYHSAFHQLEVFTHCPIHGDALTRRCFRCGRFCGDILVSARRGNPYGCPECGEPYYDSLDAAHEDLVKASRRVTAELLEFSKYRKGCFEKNIEEPELPSPERYLFKSFVLTNYERNHVNELRQTILKWTCVIGSSPEWIEKACPGIPPPQNHHVFTLSDRGRLACRHEGASHVNEDYSFRAEYKSIRRHLRRMLVKGRAQKARLRELESKTLPKFLSTREGAKRVETSGDIDHLFASAYFLFCLRHDNLLTDEKDLRGAVRTAGPQHSELLNFIDHAQVTNHVKVQAIKRIFADEYVSTMIECLMRLLAQRKHGKFVYDRSYRGNRYDPHWQIDPTCPSVMKLIVWPKKPRLSEVVRFIKRRGY